MNDTFRDGTRWTSGAVIFSLAVARQLVVDAMLLATNSVRGWSSKLQ
ncbi:hypothetical protein [Streptomyces diastatochromogenes]|nr:hypothetical protein [Streptomyces diastatochromogenes]